jgi:hypothetical protein
MGEINEPTGATVPTVGDMWMNLNAMFRRLGKMEERLRKVEQRIADDDRQMLGTVQGLEGELTVTPPPQFGP